MGVQDSDLPPWAYAQPVGNVLCSVEGEGVQQKQGQGKVVHKIALLGKLDVGLVFFMHFTQQPAASMTRHTHDLLSHVGK